MIRRAALALIALPSACSPLVGGPPIRSLADTPPAAAQPRLPAPAPPPLMIPHMADLPTRPAGAVLATAGTAPVLSLPDLPSPGPPSADVAPSASVAPALPDGLTAGDAAAVLRAWQRYCARAQNLSADDIAVVYAHGLESLLTAGGCPSP